MSIIFLSSFNLLFLKILANFGCKTEYVPAEPQQIFESLRDQFLEKDKIRENINPVVDEKIDDLKANFPEHFGDQITQSIKVQIRESQDEVVEAL